jgi:hypothetical protein
MKRLEKKRHMRDRLHLLAAILARWRHPVASSKALNLLHWAMCMVTYWCITMAIEMATKAGVILHCCFVCCCPGGRWGNTEQVVARWQHPEASGEAMDMLHWAIQAALHPRAHWPAKEVHLFLVIDFVIEHNCS